MSTTQWLAGVAVLGIVALSVGCSHDVEGTTVAVARPTRDATEPGYPAQAPTAEPQEAYPSGAEPTASATFEPTLTPDTESWDDAIAAVIASATAGAPVAVIPQSTVESLALGYMDPFTSSRVERVALLPAAPLSIYDPWCSLPGGPVRRGRLAYYADVTEGPMLATCCGELGEVAEYEGGAGETFEYTVAEFHRERRFILEIDAATGRLLDAIEVYDSNCLEMVQRSLISAVMERPLPFFADTATPTRTPKRTATSTPAPDALLADLRPASHETLARMEPLMAGYPLALGTQWVYRESCRDTRFWAGAVITQTIRSLNEARGGVLVAGLDSTRRATISGVELPACSEGSAADALEPTTSWLLTDGRFLLRTADPDRARKLIDLLADAPHHPSHPECHLALDQPELIFTHPLRPGDTWRCDPVSGRLATYSVLSQVDVDTTIGRLEGCYLLEWPWGQGTGYVWLWPGVGEVRSISSRGGSLYNAHHYELIRFRLGEVSTSE
jgi:hypothetical protein